MQQLLCSLLGSAPYQEQKMVELRAFSLDNCMYAGGT